MHKTLSVASPLVMAFVLSACGNKKDSNCSADFVNDYNSTILARYSIDTFESKVNTFESRHKGVNCMAQDLEGGVNRTVDANSEISSWRSAISSSRAASRASVTPPSASTSSAFSIESDSRLRYPGTSKAYANDGSQRSSAQFDSDLNDTKTQLTKLVSDRRYDEALLVNESFATKYKDVECKVQTDRGQSKVYKVNEETQKIKTLLVEGQKAMGVLRDLQAADDRFNMILEQRRKQQEAANFIGPRLPLEVEQPPQP